MTFQSFSDDNTVLVATRTTQFFFLRRWQMIEGIWALTDYWDDVTNHSRGFLRLFPCFREKCVLTASCSGLSRVDHTLTSPVPFIAHFSSEVCEEWHTIFNLGNLCAKIFSFFWGDRGGVAHDLQFGQFVCQKFLIFSF